MNTKTLFNDSWEFAKSGPGIKENNGLDFKPVDIVLLEFDSMDFGDEGTSKLVVYGRSAIDKNAIHVQFSNNENYDTQIIEFFQSDDYEK